MSQSSAMSQSSEDDVPRKKKKVVKEVHSTANMVMHWIGCCSSPCFTDEGLEDGHVNLRNGVTRMRSCTDVPMLLALIATITLLLWLILVPTIQSGNIKYFMGAIDYQGNVCGQDEPVVDTPWGIFADFQDPWFIRCVESCEDTVDMFGYPELGYTSSGMTLYCVPSDTNNPAYVAFEQLMDSMGMAAYIQDLYDNRWKIAYGIPFTVAFTGIFFLIIYYCMRIIIYVIIVGVLTGCSYGSYQFMQAGTEDAFSFYIGCFIAAFGVCCAFCAFCCRGNLDDVIDVCEDTSMFLLSAPMTFAVPWFSMPFTIVVIFLWFMGTQMLYVGADGYLWVEKDIPAYLTVPSLYHENDTIYNSWSYAPSEASQESWALLFLFFWCVKFIEYFNFCIVSGSVADYYFNEKLESREETSSWSCFGCAGILSSMWRTFRYHMGTVAFASLLIALLSTLQAFIAYTFENMSGSENPVARCIFSVVMCIIECVKCIIDKLNQQTLVITCVLGSPFCAGCGETLKILMTHMGYITLGTTIIESILFMGNFMISMMTTAFMGITFFGVQNQEEMYSASMPLIAIFVLSFFLSKMLLQVWGVCATTLLTCHVFLNLYYPDDKRELYDSYSKGSERSISSYYDSQASASYSASASLAEEQPRKQSQSRKRKDGEIEMGDQSEAAQNQDKNNNKLLMDPHFDHEAIKINVEEEQKQAKEVIIADENLIKNDDKLEQNIEKAGTHI